MSFFTLPSVSGQDSFWLPVCYDVCKVICNRDVTEQAEIRFCRMWILYIKIRRMQICWCTIRVGTQLITLYNC